MAKIFILLIALVIGITGCHKPSTITPSKGTITYYKVMGITTNGDTVVSNQVVKRNS